MIADLVEDLAELSNDPLRFVLWAFPWGEPGSELAKASGPEAWQVELLNAVRDGLLTIDTAIQLATTSGHGVGKSAVVSWLMLWGISTFEDTRGVVTANTETQLKTKTWAELGKWYRLFIGREMFKFTATALFSCDPDHEKTWRIDMVPWSEKNMEAFAGLHNLGKRIILIFDEASAIPDPIWETSEGALTDAGTQIIWAVFGNPTKNTGRFRECWGRFSARWRKQQVDSRTVSITNKEQFDKWAKDYGEDSDFVRVRVRGIFPRVGTLQFISEDLVAESAARDVPLHLHDPFVIGVDVARFGDDASVIYFRKGRDGRSIPPTILRGVDTMTLASKVAECHLQYRADAVFVDGGGVGGGVVDRLRQLRVPCFDVQFGGKADTDGFATGSTGILYANKRAEMWGGMREWLKTGTIWDDAQLREEICAPEYGYNVRNEIQLERKEDMKRRGKASPDIADALALTFAYPVIPSAIAGHEFAGGKSLVESEYDPFTYEVA